jgi:hypothetical protein
MKNFTIEEQEAIYNLVLLASEHISIEDEPLLPTVLDKLELNIKLNK